MVVVLDISYFSVYSHFFYFVLKELVTWSKGFTIPLPIVLA
jgi:hypothetical protein